MSTKPEDTSSDEEINEIETVTHPDQKKAKSDSKPPKRGGKRTSSSLSRSFFSSTKSRTPIPRDEDNNASTDDISIIVEEPENVEGESNASTDPFDIDEDDMFDPELESSPSRTMSLIGNSSIRLRKFAGKSKKSPMDKRKSMLDKNQRKSGLFSSMANILDAMNIKELEADEIKRTIRAQQAQTTWFTVDTKLFKPPPKSERLTATSSRAENTVAYGAELRYQVALSRLEGSFVDPDPREVVSSMRSLSTRIQYFFVYFFAYALEPILFPVMMLSDADFVQPILWFRSYVLTPVLFGDRKTAMSKTEQWMAYLGLMVFYSMFGYAFVVSMSVYYPQGHVSLVALLLPVVAQTLVSMTFAAVMVKLAPKISKTSNTMDQTVPGVFTYVTAPEARQTSKYLNIEAYVQEEITRVRQERSQSTQVTSTISDLVTNVDTRLHDFLKHVYTSRARLMTLLTIPIVIFETFQGPLHRLTHDGYFFVVPNPSVELVIVHCILMCCNGALFGFLFSFLMKLSFFFVDRVKTVKMIEQLTFNLPALIRAKAKSKLKEKLFYLDLETNVFHVLAWSKVRKVLLGRKPVTVEWLETVLGLVMVASFAFLVNLMVTLFTGAAFGEAELSILVNNIIVVAFLVVNMSIGAQSNKIQRQHVNLIHVIKYRGSEAITKQLFMSRHGGKISKRELEQQKQCTFQLEHLATVIERKDRFVVLLGIKISPTFARLMLAVFSSLFLPLIIRAVR